MDICADNASGEYLLNVKGMLLEGAAINFFVFR